MTRKTYDATHHIAVSPEGRKLIVDIYPVGFLFELRNSWRVKRFRFTMKFTRNRFSGYLAEPIVFPGKLTRCGTGWTRKRALRDLQRRLDKSLFARTTSTIMRSSLIWWVFLFSPSQLS